jgi:hypothetical protein
MPSDGGEVGAYKIILLFRKAIEDFEKPPK